MVLNYLIIMDEITSLEEQIEKLSLKFYDSISNVQKLAPLINYPNEENLENSQENKKRMEFEQIENYDENKENYQRTIEENAVEIGNTFDNLFSLLNSLTEKEEFMYSEEEIIEKIKNLKDVNEQKAKLITDKVKQTEEVITNIEKIQKDNRINEFAKRYDYVNFPNDQYDL